MNETPSSLASIVSTERVFATPTTDATAGRIVWARVKSVWYFFHLVLAVVAIVWAPSLSGFLVFLVLSAVTICAGHSVGMHRLLIHRSFVVPKWLEYLLVWLGTLVGMAGPFGMIRAHDMRDWHQRQAICPPHPAHQAEFWRDAWWQLHCEFQLDTPPKFEIEESVAGDPVLRWMERYWMAQQVPLAVVLGLLGGWSWVLWSISLRIVVSLTGHWMVGHFAHRRGHQGWEIQGLPVQGYNLRGISWLTFGENWHGNHHAFPHSARLGVEAGQSDPGYWLILVLGWLGLARDIKGPDAEEARDGLARVGG